MRIVSRSSHGYAVSVSAAEVGAFARQWPCSNLRRNRNVRFGFDSRGDLVDSSDSEAHPDADSAAVIALCADAQRYACDKLGLPHWRDRYGKES